MQDPCFKLHLATILEHFPTFCLVSPSRFFGHVKNRTKISKPETIRNSVVTVRAPDKMCSLWRPPRRRPWGGSTGQAHDFLCPVETWECGGYFLPWSCQVEVLALTPNQLLFPESYFLQRRSLCASFRQRHLWSSLLLYSVIDKHTVHHFLCPGYIPWTTVMAS